MIETFRIFWVQFFVSNNYVTCNSLSFVSGWEVIGDEDEISIGRNEIWFEALFFGSHRIIDKNSWRNIEFTSMLMKNKSLLLIIDEVKKVQWIISNFSAPRFKWTQIKFPRINGIFKTRPLILIEYKNQNKSKYL